MSDDLVKRALAAVGAPDADPESLPDLIKEARFTGSAFVYRGPYPRSEPLRKEKKGKKGRQKGGGYLGNI